MKIEIKNAIMKMLSDDAAVTELRDTAEDFTRWGVPDRIRMESARCLLSDIVAYFESKQGQREFAEWKAQQEVEKQKGARSRDLAPKQRQIVSIIVKTNPNQFRFAK